MRKFIIATLIFVFFFLQLNYQTKASEKKVVYFYVTTCILCQETEPYVDALEDQGIEVIKYEFNAHGDLFYDYAAAYFVPVTKRTSPILFVGDTFFHGEEIIPNINNQTIQELSSQPLKEIVDRKLDDFSIWALISFAFIDGINPCALAMLLLFISLLGFTSKRSTLIKVSLSYISALFISYFLLGTILYQVLHLIKGSAFIFYFYILIIILALFLFTFNLYDFIVSRNENYEKIKLQLPKAIQKYNKKIMKVFTSKLSEDSPYIYLITFGLGFIISLTEFLCTGQVYLYFITSMIHFSDTFNITSILYLLLYNFIFVLPLIIVAVLAIKTKSILGTSDFIRRHLQYIKLANALLFLIIALYFLNYFFRFI